MRIFIYLFRIFLSKFQALYFLPYNGIFLAYIVMLLSTLHIVLEYYWFRSKSGNLKKEFISSLKVIVSNILRMYVTLFYLTVFFAILYGDYWCLYMLVATKLDTYSSRDYFQSKKVQKKWRYFSIVNKINCYEFCKAISATIVVSRQPCTYIYVMHGYRLPIVSK